MSHLSHACAKLGAQMLGQAQAAKLEILDRSLPPGTVGEDYGHQLSASGGTPPYTWSIASGALPAGLELSGSGVISGKPTKEGISDFNVQVDDAAGASKLQFLSLTIKAAGIDEQARHSGAFTARHLSAACEKLRREMTR